MEIFFRRVLVYLPDQRQEEIMYHFKKVVENHFNCPYYLRVEDIGIGDQHHAAHNA